MFVVLSGRFQTLERDFSVFSVLFWPQQYHFWQSNYPPHNRPSPHPCYSPPYFPRLIIPSLSIILRQWSVGTILMGLLSFMLENTPTTGSIVSSDSAKRNYAYNSLEFNTKNKYVILFLFSLYIVYSLSLLILLFPFFSLSFSFFFRLFPFTVVTLVSIFENNETVK